MEILNDLLNISLKKRKRKYKNIIRAWSKRNVTLYGKATVIKSSINPQLTYPISFLPNPEHSLFKEIDRIIKKKCYGTASTTDLEKCGIIKVFTRGLRHYRYIYIYI